MTKRFVIEDSTEGKPSGRYVVDVSSVPDEKKKGFGESLNEAIADTPRQLGLAARYGVEGMGQVADIVGAPLASVMNKLDPLAPKPVSPIADYLAGGVPRFQKPSDNATAIANMIGLPQPRTATERVVGDASRLLAGGGGLVKGAQVIGKGVPAAANFAMRPGLQASSAVGSGLAGGYTRESGGNPYSQFVASIIGGVAAPAGVAGIEGIANATRNTISSLKNTVPPAVTIIVNNAIAESGYKPSSLPKYMRAQIESDVAAAMNAGTLSQDAVRRLIDYRMVGATPGRGNLTLNPVDVTNQHNLTKIGANSSNRTLQGLAMRQNDTTGTLIKNLNDMGANTADDAFAGGQRVVRGLEAKQQKATGQIDEAYKTARAQTGLDAQIDPSAFTQRAGDLLKANLLEGSLPSDVRNILNKAATGELPLNVSTAEQIKTAIGNLQRSTSDGGTRRALGLVRQALDESPLLPSSGVAQGANAIDAFNAARSLNRNWRSLVEKTPALQAIEDGVQPDNFVKTFIIQKGGKANVMDVARLRNAIKGSPDAVQAVREQLLAHLKGKALSGKPDEAMTFTQSGYNNALSAIGEQKLKMFFSREEIDRLKAMGRVAMYEQIQPSGSAVNNSNSGALAVAKVFDLLASSKFVNAVPFGSVAIGRPAQNIATNIQGAGMTNIPKSLVKPAPAVPWAYRIPLPLALTPNLLKDSGN